MNLQGNMLLVASIFLTVLAPFATSSPITSDITQRTTVDLAHPSAFGTPLVGEPSTTPNTGFNALGAAADPYIVFCQTANCAITSPPSCYSYTLTDRVRGNCYALIGSNPSVYITQPNSGGLPYSVYVGSGCNSGARLPAVNTCYNISPPATSFWIQ